MARPAVGPVTERVYGRLPDVYRDADAEQAEPDYPLLRYLSLLLDQLSAVEELGDRLSFTARADLVGRWQRFGDGTYGSGTYGDRDTADLVDARRADAAWLPWLAQLLGVTIDGLTLDEQRDALVDPARTWARGTPGGLADAVRPQLSGYQYVDTRPNYGGNPFVIALITARAETSAATTFAELKAIAPTFRELEALGDFSNIEAADVIRAAEPARPAGYKLTHVYLEDLPADE